MPYQNWDDVNPAIKGIDPRPSLAQARMIADWADRIEQKGEAENAWAAAIALFKKTHHVEGGKWVKNEDSTAEHTEELLDLLCDVFRDEEDPVEEIGPAYVVDLMAELPRDAQGQVDFSQPFRILPVGTFHRRGSARSVTEADVDQFADNWAHRTERGIRRKRVVIDVEHEPGGVGQYAHILSRGSEGLWAQIELSAKGQRAIRERDFYFFSPTVAWRSQDRKTGEIVKNQIVGGALTNHPFFGDETALPLGYSEPARRRLWQAGHALEGYATKREDGVEYPASAYLVVEDPDHPDTWHLRVKEYVDGRLIYTKNMCGRAAAALNPQKPYRGRPYQGPNKDKAKAKLRSIYLNQLKVPREEVPSHLFSVKGDQTMATEFTTEELTTLQKIAAIFGGLLPKLEGGDTMPDNGDPKDKAVQISPEAFATMQTQLAELTDQVTSLSQERDQLKTQVQEGRQQLAAETYARLLQEMKAHVQQFAHLALPLELADDAPEGSMTAPEYFVWLRTVDDTAGKQHWAFFNAVLQAADAALQEAGALEELGGGGGADELMDEDEKLHQKALTYAEKHKVDYVTALKAVATGATVPETG